MATIKLTSFYNSLANRVVQSSNILITNDNTNIYFNSSLAGTNIGGPLSLYLNSSNNTLNFKSLNAGSYLSLNLSNTTLVINATNVVQTAGSYLSFNSGSINNLAPDQIISFNSTTLAISGLYPTFVLNYTGNAISYSAGSYISINNSGIVSNLAPDQVVTLVGFNNLSITGVYPSYGVVGSGTNKGGVYLIWANTNGIYNPFIAEGSRSGLGASYIMPSTGIFSRMFVGSIGASTSIVTGVVQFLLNGTTTSLNVTIAGFSASNITDVVVVKPLDIIGVQVNVAPIGGPSPLSCTFSYSNL